MKTKNVFLLIFFPFLFSAQISDNIALGAAYRYTGRNVAQLGLQYKIWAKYDKTFIVGASALYSSINGKGKIVPEINFNFGNDGFNYAVSASQYAIEPRVGLNFLNIFWINTGYAIPIDKNQYFKGITFGLQFNFAKDPFYQPLRIGF